jgi:putative CocE/NonD family hydrolase
VDVVVEKNVAAPMRDGTVLRSDVYRPATPGRYPVLLQRTPYGKEMWPLTAATLDPVRAAAAGFVVVIQDVRGRWASDGGTFSPYRDEFADGDDTAGWVSTLPYGTGRVGAYGVSYAGATAWHAAVGAPGSLGAISATTAPNDFFVDHVWRGGAFLLGTLAMWSLQAIGLSALSRAHGGTDSFLASLVRLVDDIDEFDRWTRYRPLRAFPPARPDDADLLPFFFEILGHPLRDDYARARSVSERHGEVGAPALILAGWHDLLLAADLQHYRSMREQAATERAREGTRLVIGPWSHGMFLNVVGDLDFGLRSSGAFLDLREDLTALQLRWFGHWLSDEAPARQPEGPRVRLFVQGVNRWRDADDWPLAGVSDRRLHLRSGGGLTFEPPVDGEPPDAYAYDPERPCPTQGGTLLMPRQYPAGPVDQGPLLHRPDVLCFTSAPLDRELEVIGHIRAVLHAATSAPDTDWVVKLCRVDTAGRTLNVSDGILRASYRRSPSERVLVEPGAVERYEVDLWATAIAFAPGERLRVLVTSSDFPRYDRNPNTGELGVEAASSVPALQRIFHDREHPSHLVLPVT